EIEHVRARRVCEDGVRDDVVKLFLNRRQLQGFSSVRIEEERKAIVKDPVRTRELLFAFLDRLLNHVEAPVTLGIDRAIRIAQHVADVAAEVEHALTTPVLFTKL